MCRIYNYDGYCGFKLLYLSKIVEKSLISYWNFRQCESLISGSDFSGEELGKCRGIMAYTLGNLVWSLRTSYTDQQNI